MPFNGGLTRFENGKFTVYDSTSFPLHNATGFIETPYGDIIFGSSGRNTQNAQEAYIALYKGNKFERIDESKGINLVNPVLRTDPYDSPFDDEGNTWVAFSGLFDFVADDKGIRSGVLKYDGTRFIQYPGLEKYLKATLTIGSVFFHKETGKIFATSLSSAPRSYSINNVDIFEFRNGRWFPSDIYREIGRLRNLRSGEVISDFSYTDTWFYSNGKTLPSGFHFNTGGTVGSSANPGQYYTYNKGKWEKYDAVPGNPELDLHKGLLISNSKGIGFYHPEESRILKEKDGLASTNVGIPNFYVDRNQIIWMSYSYSELPTYAEFNDHGINLWDGKQLRSYTTKDGLTSNTTFNYMHDNQERLWLGTSKGAMLIREFKNTRGDWVFKFKAVFCGDDPEQGVTSFIETKKGEIYAWQNYVRPAYGEMEAEKFFLGRYNGEKFVSIPSPFSESFNNKKYQMVHLREDKKGRLWLEGRSADLIQELTSVKNEILIFDGNKWNIPPESWGIPNEQLYFVGELDNGAYYLTVGHFYKFDGERFIDLSDSVSTDADYRVLKGASVTGTKTEIQVDDWLYIRLRNRGLVVFNGTKLKYYTPKEGFFATDIHDPIVDLRGNLFFSSIMGAVMINEDRFRIYFDDENIAAGGPNAVTIDGEGNFFKYYNGIGLYIDQQKESRLDLKLTSMEVNSADMFFRFPKKLSYDENSILFNFSTLTYDDPAETTFEYFLEGVDKEWSKPSNLSYAEYQNLSPGDYVFKVMAKTANGFEMDQTEFEFSISPPWWNTWWSYTLYLFLFMFLMFSIRRIELRRQFKNARIKESELKAKAAELQVQAAEAQSRAIQAENERKSKELEEARTLQLSLLPKDVPVHPQFQISTYMKTATEVGGDYYDFSFHEDGSLNVAIGDATGHGMKAGTLVSMMKSLFTANSMNMDITEFFASSNIALKKMHLDRVMMGFAMLRINGSSIKTINAGMPHYFHFVKKTGEVQEIKINGMPLGAMEQMSFAAIELSLAKGDTLLMMSDGMPELLNSKNEMFGYERIADSFAKTANNSPEKIIEIMNKVGSEWSGDRDPEDDITFVVLKMK